MLINRFGERDTMGMRRQSKEHFHAFSKLVLTLTDTSFAGAVTESSIELRACGIGVEVWRYSILKAGDENLRSDERYVGSLTSRQTIGLLEEIERSGIYEVALDEAAPDGVPAPNDSELHVPVVMVSLRLENHSIQRIIFEKQPADHIVVGQLTEAVRRLVDVAMEQALTRAG